MEKVKIVSEINRLSKIMIHSPGSEHALATPYNVHQYNEDVEGEFVIPNPDYLLFDDLVLVPWIQKEHKQLEDVLVSVCGKDNVFRFRNLLSDIFHSDKTRRTVVDEVIALEKTYGFEVLESHKKKLLDLEPENLAKTMVRGFFTNSNERVFRWPLPNAIFARDLAAVLGNAVILSYAKKNARKRDMLLSRNIFRFHKNFAGTELIDLQKFGENLSVEGGDVLIISDKIVLVGISERTKFDVIPFLAKEIFKQGFEVLYAVDMPKHRATMHLDTIFTRINKDECLVFPPIILAEGPKDIHLNVYRFTSESKTFEPKNSVGSNLVEILEKDGVKLNPILCGGNNLINQMREQWSDGANAFAVAEGKILLYERNHFTLRELNKAGYEIITAENFVQNTDFYLMQTERKMVITISGFELSRGRGGPRCLTCPIFR